MIKYIDLAIAFFVGIAVGVVILFYMTEEEDLNYVCYTDYGFEFVEPDEIKAMDVNIKELCFQYKEVQ